VLRRLRAVATWLMFFLGFASILLGFEGGLNNHTVSSLWFQMATIGGSALFGASLSLLIEQLLGTDVSDIRNYLMQNEHFQSAPDHLDTVIGDWHHYDISSVKGRRVWQYLKVTLARGDMRGTLKGSFTQIGPTGRKRKYSIEAGIRGGTLITIIRSEEGDEHNQIQIVPKITRTHLNAAVGLQIMETWDGFLCASYVIYSKTKMCMGDTLTGQCQVLCFNQVCLLARRRLDSSVAISIQRSMSVFMTS
jgi:hypothetical protein